MHLLRGKRGLIGGLLFALAAAVALPVTVHAGPDPEARRPNTGRYRLFAGNLGAITINRLYYGMNTKGEVGVDSLNSSTVGGGFWPKGSGNQYMFNSGLQVAGIIQGGAENPWALDTTGAMFFDASGLRQHGTAVTELYNSVSPVDQANWPQAAYVPQGDASEEQFDNLLRGRLSASQGDVWFMSTEADPGLNAARPHPLGIVAEYRVMGWNYPAGNEDLIYLIVTFYNITSLNAADYAQYRPGIRELLLEQAQQFHSLNNAAFTVDLPDAGYTIDPFYAAFAADPDVTTSATTNFSSVNLPFAMGYAYHRDFPRAAGWTFSPNIFGAPFFAGAGFVGIKYLKSATGPGEIALYSNTTNGGAFPDPNSAVRLYKYMSGDVTPADGVSCNQGDPLVSRICYVGNATAADVRMMQSSTPIALAAGQSASIVVSYIHAAPVQIPGYVGGQPVLPGDPTRLSNAALLVAGANRVDSIMGFAGYSDANADGIVQQNEFRTVRSSLLDKANTAQLIFDNKFLLPFAPDAPDFFLIPGDGQVTVVWKPSATETVGDPYFAVAKDAQVVPPGGGAPVPNALYDANYRQFDVEGYRIYRGRSDTPTGLRLIAVYDYAGSRFADFTGQVVNDERGTRCAPELGVTSSCAGVFETAAPGLQLTRKVLYDINGSFVQVQLGNRALLASGDVINLATDTAVTGRESGLPALGNSGVPFVYVDNEPRNGLTYFYAVTAFDVNSINSTGAGNTSLESARITKRVVPGSRASNFVNEGSIEIQGLFGRGVPLTDETGQSIDPATGRLDKKAAPSNGLSVTITGLVRSVLPTGTGQISVRLDSITLGDPNAGVPHSYYYSIGTVGSEAARSVVVIALDPSEANAETSANSAWGGGGADPDLATPFGGGEGFVAASGTLVHTMPGSYYTTIYGRGCVNGATGFGAGRLCSYNGPRWFSGENETKDHPNAGNYAHFNIGQPAVPPFAYPNVDNAGELQGVAHLQFMLAYENTQSGVQAYESILSGGFSAGDFRVYWGAGGVVDSVLDLTHNVPVPFDTRLSATWGILNQNATTATGSFDQRPAVLTISDVGCVTGVRGKTNGGSHACSSAAPFELSQTAVPGPIAFYTGTPSRSRTAPVANNSGFVFYMKGYPFMVELEGGQLPADGTEWTLRTYAGAIAGGVGNAGTFNGGVYTFTGRSPRPFQALGTEMLLGYDVTNQQIASSAESLEQVHTVPDPYYVTSALEATTVSKKINFVNLPASATIRIYTTSGVLVRALKHETTTNGGETTWDVRNRNNQFVASGVYFYHVTAENGETTVGRMTIINYAQ